MAYVLDKLFWFDGEQGNNRCLCLSHIFNAILWMGGVILLHTQKTDITQTCSKNTERYQSGLIEQTSLF